MCSFLWYYDAGYPRFSNASHWKTATHVYTHNKHPNMRCFLELFFFPSASFDFKWSCKFALVCMFYSKVTIGVPHLCGPAIALPHPAVLSLAHLPQSARVDTTAAFMWINPQPSFLYSGGNAWQEDVRLTQKKFSPEGARSQNTQKCGCQYEKKQWRAFCRHLRDRTRSCSSSEIACTCLTVLCDDHSRWREETEWIPNFPISALKNSIRPYAPAGETKILPIKSSSPPN